jgi:adenylate kinase
MCSKCGKNYNVADIYLPAEGGRPEIVMPPLNPPARCMAHMEQRSDDNGDTVRHRLKVYKESAAPIENYYRQQGVLVDFEITAGIPETLPRLLKVLEPYVQQQKAQQQQQQQAQQQQAQQQQAQQATAAMVA